MTIGKLLLLIIPVSLFVKCGAQDYSKRFSSTRYSFAKAYFGMDIDYVPGYGNSSFLNLSANTLESFKRNSFISPAVNFGGTHFWGYTDFYISINTLNLKTRNDRLENRTSLGVSTGFRLYPIPVRDNKIRPYAGYKFAPFSYTQKQVSGEFHKQFATKSIFDIGIGYMKPGLYCYIGYNRVVNPNFETYVSRTQKVNTTYPKHYFSLGVNWMVETTKGEDPDKVGLLDQKFSKSNIAGLFFGIGASSVLPLVSSTYIKDLYPFLADKPWISVAPDISAGYHFTKQDFSIVASFRPISQSRKAFSFSQKITRSSLLLEGYKYLFDYHGFSPFIGGGISYENIKLTETDKGTRITNLIQNKLTPVITFGWDIRPDGKIDPWLLRTNLRYSPVLKLKHNKKILSLQQLEFNFIQFVLYPQRLKLYRKR